MQVIIYMTGPIFAFVVPGVAVVGMFVVAKLWGYCKGHAETVHFKTFVLHARAAFVILLFLIYNKVRVIQGCLVGGVFRWWLVAAVVLYSSIVVCTLLQPT